MHRRNRRTRTLLAIGLALSGAGAALAVSSANGAPAPPHDSGGKPAAIVSMGDSFISGEGGRWAGNANPKSAQGSVYGTDRAAVRCNKGETSCKHDLAKVYGNTSYESGNRCDRSDVAEIKGADVDGVPPARRFNIACSGAETKHVINQSFKGETPQVKQLAAIASNNRVKMIVLSIGGNDLKFSDILASCARNFVLGRGPCNKTKSAEVSSNLGRVKTGVASSLDAIRTVMRKAGYDDGAYALVLQSYPNPLPTAQQVRYPGDHYDRYIRGGFPFYNKDADWAHNSVVPRISKTLRDVARSKKAAFLDLADAFAGHELGAAKAKLATARNSSAKPLPAARAEWVRWVPYLSSVTKRFGSDPQGDQQEAVHPNAYGQQALSRCLSLTARQYTSGSTQFSCRAPGRGGPEAVQVSPTGGEPASRG